MGTALSKEESIQIFGPDALSLFEQEYGPYRESLLFDKKVVKDRSISKEKLEWARSESSQFQIFGLVKFVAVTGSVGAGIAKADDDIDLFIVVKNYTSWIYRGLLMVKLFKKVLHFNDEEKTDKLCINFISEVRGLAFEDKDIFTLHEILYMKPIYNPGFKDEIISSNQWIYARYGLEARVNSQTNRMAILSKFSLIWLNFLSMMMQFTYMLFSGHSPNRKRLWREFKKGRIAFYPEYFRLEKLKDFENALSQVLKS